MSDLFEQLASPFDPSEVDWRVGSTTADKSKGMALAYIDARTVMDRLDAVCGPAGWQCRYVLNGTKTVCELGIKCQDEWVWKSDGAGDSDIEAEKGALSDAFKRAAVRWGIGRYLYNLKSPWVELKAFGKSYIIADSAKPQLEALLRANKPTAKPTQEPTKPSQEEAQNNAKQYVENSLVAIGQCLTIRALEDWTAHNAAKIARLTKAYPDEAIYVTHALKTRREAIQVNG
jgi:hypothetical protein